jgi:hypothetical protein
VLALSVPDMALQVAFYILTLPLFFAYMSKDRSISQKDPYG